MSGRQRIVSTSEPAARPASAIIPGQQPALRTLVIAMSVMCYLASLAIGGLMLINRAIDDWTSDIAREVTVQVKPVEGRDTEADLQRVAAIAAGFDGVSDVQVIGVEATAELLEPWLGKGRVIEDLPVPRLVAVAIDGRGPPDFAALETALKAEVPGASLDTHRHWQDELTRFASVLEWLGIVVLLVVVVAAVTLVVQVTRTALAANREVVEVLYLVGAKDRFIAGAVARRFLAAGMIGGLAGAAGALATIAAVGLSGYVAAPEGLAEASGNLIFSPSGTSTVVYLWFLAVPLIATVICLATARLAVLRILREMF
jgi:cell division transport system permease protein